MLTTCICSVYQAQGKKKEFPALEGPALPAEGGSIGQ